MALPRQRPPTLRTIFQKRHPVPHVYPNLNLSNYISRGSVGWRTWRRFNWRPPLWRAIWPFLLQLIGGYGLTNDQQVMLDHERMLSERRCHSWNGMGWCFCEGNR